MKVKANARDVALFEQSGSPFHTDLSRSQRREIPSRLAPLPGWNVERYPGFVLHDDAAISSVENLADDVAAGLSCEPKALPSRLLYDAVGSALFGAITQQPEYYLTRTEEGLLQEHAGTLGVLTRCRTLVELGGGNSAKTRQLLDVWSKREGARYLPIDVSGDTLRAACSSLARRYPRLQIEGIASSYQRALPLLRQASPFTVAFLGSSIGNLDDGELEAFFRLLATELADGDFFLVGFDLVKAKETIEAAYNDRAGCSAAFTRNIFARMNRELGTELPLDLIDHLAFYDPEAERVEIYAKFRAEIAISLPGRPRPFVVRRGERVRTEISRKFYPLVLHDQVERHGFRLIWETTDSRARFGLALYRRET